MGYRGDNNYKAFGDYFLGLSPLGNIAAKNCGEPLAKGRQAQIRKTKKYPLE
jgi:hypothetical protein